MSQTAIEALQRLIRNGQKQGWNDSYPEDMEFATAALSALHAKAGVSVEVKEPHVKVSIDLLNRIWAEMYYGVGGENGIDDAIAQWNLDEVVNILSDAGELETPNASAQDYYQSRMLSAVSVCKLVIEYDDILRHWEGKEQVLLSGDVAEIDAAYDKMVEAARTALSSPLGKGE